ncbi:acetyltransferase [Nonomuraea sp. SMC257]|uniref:Acetyltransferase n=1 Tax=Nonomuraea montanisoli TaxID=2741721 RepID=A0A7Y6M1Y9_9ACTN|nr:acetyltransferase [Nonomuraea montanisoli]NUW30931.1 acetyltransferase [Nonomuraea montanisoli]
MGKLKKSAVTALGLVAALAGTIVTSGPAAAASSPVEACGGGSYHVIDSHALGSSATIYLLYNGTTNCVVTWKTGARGNTTYVEARLRHDGMYFRVDPGHYQYYAGPVKVDAGARCIMWGGGYGDTLWTSGWEHCR